MNPPGDAHLRHTDSLRPPPLALALLLLALREPAAAAPFTVLNTADSGPGSLRQAILDANVNPGADTIVFTIPGAGLHTITPLSALPPLTDDAGATIDGYTQPGSSPNTLPVGDNALLRIELKGTSAGVEVSGLVLQSSNNSVRGLVVNRFERGISVASGSNNTISGCFIGTDSSGMAASPNRLGVVLSTPDPSLVVTGNVVGGTDPGSRNVISGNSSDLPGNYSAGVIVGLGVSNGVIAGNYIGTNAAGSSALPNGANLVGDGVNLTAAAFIVVGGAGKGAGNVISGNVGSGINAGFSFGTVIQGNLIGTDASGTAALPNRTGVHSGQNLSTIIGGSASARNVISGNVLGINISFGSKETLVDGNFIGTDITGRLPLGNTQNGISIRLFSTNNTVGVGESNVIAFNGGAGVTVGSDVTDTSAGNRVSGNSIHDNGGLGIDLASDGPTPNDAADPDAGPNTLQNFPVLSSATSNGISTAIQGTLNSLANTTYRIQFFSNPDCDPSGNGEGKTFLGETSVTTDGSGNADFQAPLPPLTLTERVLTATATDPDGNTSEFSLCLQVVFVPPVAVPLLDPTHLFALALLVGAAGAAVLRFR